MSWNANDHFDPYGELAYEGRREQQRREHCVRGGDLAHEQAEADRRAAGQTSPPADAPPRR